MTNPLFFASPAQLAGLRPAESFTLGGAEGRHAVDVKRLRAGEFVDVADGAGRRISGIVTGAAGSELTVRVEAVRDEPAADPRLMLVQALAKGGRDELGIEAATELGVDAIVPWQADRSIVRWKSEKAAKGRRKWAATVQAAAKQARRAVVPEVLEVADSRQLAELVRTADAALLLHEDATEPLAAAVERIGTALRTGRELPSGVRTVLLIVGPEGGISDAEVGLMVSAGANPVRMGPHVLRSSTAGPAALAVVCDRMGRWSGG